MAIETRWEEKRAFVVGLARSASEATSTSNGQLRFARDALVLLVLAAVYFLAGKLGLKLAYFHPSATAVWPATGISLVAFLVMGYRVWPGIFLAALLVNLTTAGSLL